MAQIKGNGDKQYHETALLVDRNGYAIDSDNPLRISLGTDNVTITGNVNIGTTVEISNNEGSPIPTHAHLFDENDSEYSATNPLTIAGIVDVDAFGSIDISGSTMPIDGVVDVDEFGGIDITGSTMPVSGTVNIGTIPEVEIKNDSNNPISIIGTTINPWGRTVLTVDDDTVQHTSHNRRKVSTYEITDFATFPFSKNEVDFDEQITGTSSSTHQPYLGMVQLSVGGSAGDQVIRQTRRVQRYLPGRGNEASFSVILDSVTAGVRTRVGVFDTYNGVYFEHDGTDYYCVIRRNTAGGVVEERVARADWSDDKMDGTGPSGITINYSNIQLMVIEYEWYGAGQVEWKFVIDNNAFAVHKINHANLYDHTWASGGAFPVRYELTNVTGATGTHTMLQGSHSFLTEGTTTLLGRQSSISSPTTGYNLATAGTFYPVLAIRLKSTALNSVVIPDEFAAGLLDKTDMFIRVIERPTTVTGGTWISAGAESPIEYNITATSFTGGTIASTKFISEKQMGESITFPERTITQIGRKTTTVIGDTSEVFMIAAAATDNDKDAWVSLGWIEVR